MVTKAEINAVLKACGNGFVKMSTGSYGPNTQKTYKENGKMVKGIPAASYGPMTVTDMYRVAINEKAAELQAALTKAGMVFDTERECMVANSGTKKEIVLFLREVWLPAYTRSANLDSGYKNIYLVPVFGE